MLEPSHILWNLFLALIPVVLAFLIAGLYWRFPRLRPMWWLWAPLALLWFGFLPNTCYLLTEWRHFIALIVLNPDQIRAAAHDKLALLNFLALSTFYVLYSGIGLIAFSMAIWPLDQLLKTGRLFKGLFFFICALGVYLGLVKRLNTWDIWHNPGLVLQAALEAATHPLLVLLILCFACVIWFNYWIFEVFVDGLLVRWRRIKQSRQARA